MSKVSAGDKIARAKAARYIKSKKGTEGIEVSFEFTEPSTGGVEHLSWVGWLSDAAREHSEDTLFDTLGCNGNIKQRDANGVFTDAAFLDYKREVKLVVDLEARQKPVSDTDSTLTMALDKEGNQIFDARIKWVNSLGGPGYTGVAPDEGIGAGLSAFQATALQRRKTVPNMAPGASMDKKSVPF